MSYNRYKTQSGSFFTCTKRKEHVVEYTIPDHLIIYVYSGKVNVTTLDCTYSILAGPINIVCKEPISEDKKGAW